MVDNANTSSDSAWDDFHKSYIKFLGASIQDSNSSSSYSSEPSSENAKKLKSSAHSKRRFPKKVRAETRKQEREVSILVSTNMCKGRKRKVKFSYNPDTHGFLEVWVGRSQTPVLIDASDVPLNNGSVFLTKSVIGDDSRGIRELFMTPGKVLEEYHRAYFNYSMGKTQ